MTGILWQIIYSRNSSSYLELSKNCTQAKKGWTGQKQHLGFRQFSQGRCLSALVARGISWQESIDWVVCVWGVEAEKLWLRRTAVLSQTL